MGEVLALMRKGGVDGHLAFDVLTNSLFDSRVHKSYGEKIVDGRYFPPGLTAPLAIKDLRLALAEAERAAVPMPAAALVLGHCGPHIPNNPLVTDADALSSYHPQGVHFLFGDGSIHFIGSSISVQVYDALASRAGGEVVGDY